MERSVVVVVGSASINVGGDGQINSERDAVMRDTAESEEEENGKRRLHASFFLPFFFYFFFFFFFLLFQLVGYGNRRDAL